MLNNFHNIKKIVINDINTELVKLYKTIKDAPTRLIEILKDMEAVYLSLPTEMARKEKFLEIREKFNQHNLDDIFNSACFVFLNKTCFNGLYRVNSKGDFNVPFGKYKNPKICNSTTIIADSEALNAADVIITNGDFSDTARYIDKTMLNFFYFDPPYRPISATSSFTAYSKSNFNDGDQKRLAEFSKYIDKEHCLWMLSNSDSSLASGNDSFFEKIYFMFHIERVTATRSINSDASKRGRLTELLIHNDYKLKI